MKAVKDISQLTTADIDHRDYLYWMCMETYERLVLPGIKDNPEKQKEYMDRLDYELGVIAEMGFIDYFLIVQDYVNYARDHGMPTGPGRGCLLPGVKVLTANRGPVPIEDVVRGDRVFDEAGEEVLVETTHRYDLDEKVVLLKVDTSEGIKTLGLTPDHKVLFRQGGPDTGWTAAEFTAAGHVIALGKNGTRGGHRVVGVRTEHRSGFVYDLTVATENEPSYLTECGMVHNSAAGSLVSYLAGITRVDPIPFRLYFERFLNPDRIGMPDIDVDFPQSGRQAIMEYVRNRYTSARAAQVMTFGYERPKGSIKDMARVLGFSPTLADKITKTISEDLKATIASELELGGDFAKMYNSDPDVKRIVDTAKKVEGLVRGDSIHASAFVIAPHDIANFMPMQTPKGQQGTMSADDTASFIVQYDGTTVEKLGYLKMDFLGLGNLDAIANTQRLIKKIHGIDIDLEDVPFDDKKTLALLRRAETAGLFQLESEGMRKTLKQVAPTRFSEISDIIALYRPGPMEYIPQYIEGKSNPSSIQYLDARLKPILEDTYGICVYQEQNMEIAKQIAGFSMSEADTLRKAIGKKKADLMESLREKFADGCRAATPPVEESTIVALWALMEAAAAYSFNKCTSGDTLVTRSAGGRFDPSPDISVARLYENWHSKTAVGNKYRDKKRGVKILSLDGDGRIRPRRVAGVYEQGVQPLFAIRTDGGRELKVTGNHRSLTSRGWLRTDEMAVGDSLQVSLGYEYVQYDYRTSPTGESRLLDLGTEPSTKGKRGFQTAEMNPGYIDGSFVKLREWQASTPDVCACDASHAGRIETHHKDRDRTNNEPENLEKLCVSCHKKADYALGRTRRWEKGHAAGWDTITSIEFLGEEMTYDVEMEADPNGTEANAFGHNFLADGIVTHNSHSVAYAFLAWYTAYFKANYPAEFMCSMMSYRKDHPKAADFLNSFFKDCHRYGVAVLPPHVNRSGIDFDVANPMEISFGLSALKGIGEGPAAFIVAERERNGQYKDLNDFLSRIDPKCVNSGVVTKLAVSGALDGLGWTRKALTEEIERIKDFIGTLKKGSKHSDDQPTFDFFDEIEVATIQPETDEEYPPDELLEMEKAHLGFYLTGNPMEYYEISRRLQAKYLPKARLYNVSDLHALEDGEEAYVFGVISRLYRYQTKKGDYMAFINLSDFGKTQESVHGYSPELYEFDSVVFPKAYAEWGYHLHEGDFVKVRGSIKVKPEDGRKSLAFEEVSVLLKDSKLNREDPSLAAIASDIDATMAEEYARWSQPAAEGSGRLEIELAAEQAAEFLAVVERFPGDTPATLIVDGRRKDLGGVEYNSKLRKLLVDFLDAKVRILDAE